MHDLIVILFRALQLFVADIAREQLVDEDASNAGRAPAPDVTGKPHMAKIAQLFSMCSQELMMGIRRGR